MMNKTLSFSAVLLLLASGHIALAESYTTEGANCFQEDPDDAGSCPKLNGDPKYVRENFAFNLSRDVSMNTVEAASAIGVNTAHTDGLYTYGASSQGGAVKKCGEKRTDFTAAEGLAPGTPTATKGCGEEEADG